MSVDVVVAVPAFMDMTFVGLEGLPQLGALVGEDGHREEARVGGSRLADGQRPHGHAPRHLHDREQRVHPFERMALHRHAEHRHERLRRHHPRQMRRAPRARDDHRDAPLLRALRERRHQLRRAMCRHDAALVRHAELRQHLIRMAQLGEKLDPAEQVRVMGDRNFGMHLKDHDNKKKTDVIYGKGELDVPAVLRALKDVKFKGYISIEYEAHPEDPSPTSKSLASRTTQLKRGIARLIDAAADPE